MNPVSPTYDKISRACFQLGFVFWLAQVFAIFSSWRYLPPQLPLFYSRPWGEEQLTNPLGLVVLPGTSIVIVSLNFFLAATIARKTTLIRQIIAVAAAVFSFFCLVTLVQIIKLVV